MNILTASDDMYFKTRQQFLFMSINTLVQVALYVNNIARIAQATLKFVN